MLKPLSSIDASIRAKSLTWIARQINACLKKHNTCEDTSVSNLPTRVVDVNYAPQRVRIISTNGASGTYITLSHCWGDPGLMSTKLTAHNLEEYMNEGISIEDLSRTFRDAVELTKDLGVSYLWIDSLCIVQADPSKDRYGKSHQDGERGLGAGVRLHVYDFCWFIRHSGCNGFS